MKIQKRLFFTLWMCCISIVLLAQGQAYKRIISLAPSLTQSLYYMDANDQLVGCTSYCKMALKDKKEIVASAVKPNIERIVWLKPDLVVCSGLTNPEDIETLKKFGIRVEVFRTPQSFDEICKQFVELGTLIGKQKRAADIVARSKQEVELILAKTKGEKKRKIFFQIGANPIYAVIPNTFMNDYIRFLGSENIAKSMTSGSVGREFVIANNPDCIFIATMGIVGEEEKQTWEKYKNLSATKKRQIHIIDSEIACQPTPVTFVQTMKVMDKMMNSK